MPGCPSPLFLFPPLSFPPLPFPPLFSLFLQSLLSSPLSYPPLPLEVGPYIVTRRSGEHLSSPSGVRGTAMAAKAMLAYL